jgi:hypothetical protein
MRVDFLREGESVDPRDVEALFGMDLSHALKHRLISPAQGEFRNGFVGWWSIVGAICLSLPKVFPAEPSVAQLRALTTALKRYRSSGVRFTQDDSAQIWRAEDLPFLFEELSEHTLAYGWHSKDEWTETEQLDDADWSRTSSEMIGVDAGSGLVFFETIGSRPSNGVGALRAIQAKALVELWEGFSNILLDFDSRHLAMVEEARSISFDVEVPDCPEEIVRAHIDANRDHDRRLAELLSQWLGIHVKSKSVDYFNGTSNFETVWEEMLRSAISLACGGRLLHSSIASQPVYRRLDGSFLFKPRGQRPDIVVPHGNAISIIDPKWYRQGTFPGTDDVMKQFAYAITSQREVAANAMVVPQVDGSPRIIGSCTLEMDEGRDPRFREFTVIGVATVEVLEAYANRSEAKLGKAILDLLAAG